MELPVLTGQATYPLPSRSCSWLSHERMSKSFSPSLRRNIPTLSTPSRISGRGVKRAGSSMGQESPGGNVSLAFEPPGLCMEDMLSPSPLLAGSADTLRDTFAWISAPCPEPWTYIASRISKPHTFPSEKQAGCFHPANGEFGALNVIYCSDALFPYSFPGL